MDKDAKTFTIDTDAGSETGDFTILVEATLGHDSYRTDTTFQVSVTGCEISDFSFESILDVEITYGSSTEVPIVLPNLEPCDDLFSQLWTAALIDDDLPDFIQIDYDAQSLIIDALE